MNRRTRTLVQLAGVAALVTGLVALSLTPAFAAKLKFFASLDGPQSENVCPQGSPGTGTATVAYNDVTNVLSWNIPYEGLSGPATAAHFHGPAGPNVNAVIQVDFGIALDSPIVGSIVIDAIQEADLLAGLWYVNIHSAKCPPGEIRGQVLAPPVGGVPLDSKLEGVAVATPDAPDGGAGLLPWIIAASSAGALMLAGAGLYMARKRAD